LVFCPSFGGAAAFIPVVDVEHLAGAGSSGQSEGVLGVAEVADLEISVDGIELRAPHDDVLDLRRDLAQEGPAG
jgi:hypothetical protein